MHLWFLPALLAYSTLVALALLLVQASGSGTRLRSIAAALAGHQAFALPVVLVLAVLWEIAIDLSHTRLLAMPSPLAYLLAHGVDPYLRYLPFFMLGVVLWSVPPLRSRLVWQSGWTLPLAASLVATSASLLRGRTGAEVELLHNAADAIAAILVSAVLIGCATRFWNRPDRTVDRIVDASFTIYLLHHPLIYGLVTLFLLVAWPPVLEFVIVCLLTLLISYGAHRILRKNRLALFLFNGVPMRSRNAPTAPPKPVEGTLR